MTVYSPFLNCNGNTQENQLAILHLKRDQLISAILRSHDNKNEGYDEGVVTNTRFGSFPHSTLIDIPWGTQVRASAVDTGSRGRKGWEGSSKKRKREDGDNKRAPTFGGNVADDELVMAAGSHIVEEPRITKSAVEAKSGFVHVLPPTAELWTASLPHRTQVVYTPDYSYILHRIKARPGTRLIEAGAGSGSFAHAAARAVFNGYPSQAMQDPGNDRALIGSYGKIYSYEFHEPRAEKLKQEISEHGLDDIVELTSRDVCGGGFAPSTSSAASIRATAIFLDLPAPWLALKHLTREQPGSPLDPNATVHICTFSPCLEQVQRTITTMRQLGWLEVEMVDVAAKKVEVRRERIGLQEEGLRGVDDSPATVDEALEKLRDVEGRAKVYYEEKRMDSSDATITTTSKQQRLQNIKAAQKGRKLYKEGRLITRDEPELKIHTSYLVFAVLPRQWTAGDESKAREAWPERVELEEPKGPISKRAIKKAAKIEATKNQTSVVEEGKQTAQAEINLKYGQDVT